MRFAKLPIVAAVLAALIAAAALGLWAWPGPGGPAPPAFAGRLGPFAVHAEPKPVADLAFAAPPGRPESLAGFRGKVVLLNLWATWCAPCVEEMPALDRLQLRAGGRDFEVVALSLDREGRSVVEPFLAEHKIAHLGLYIDAKSAAQRALGVRGLPTTLLIGRDGREIGRLEGQAEWDSPAAAAFIAHFVSPPAR